MYWTDGQVALHQGDVREVLREMPAESVQCVVTSPPYWGLRDYGTATWDGGDAECNHEPPNDWIAAQFNANSNLAGVSGQSAAAKKQWFAADGSCRCGARRIDRQLGLEPTPEGYVTAMVDVFREVRRVLRDDGTLWLNIGDTYNAYNGGAGPSSSLSQNQSEQRPRLATGYGLQAKSLKPKDLVGIPWMLAFALRADGWWLRQDIIWHKPNPMPESVRDRCTKAHEYVFLMSKNERYLWNRDAMREPAAWERWGDQTVAKYEGTETATGWMGSGKHEELTARDTRNKRSVWTIPTAPFPEAHFATFPPALVEPCILAGSREGDVVLDPFIGSGTTAMVARQLGRRAIGIDLNSEYLAMARRRVGEQLALLDGAR